MYNLNRKHKGYKMKHTIIVIVSSVILIGSVAFAVHHYDEKHHIQQVKQAQARAAELKRQEAAKNYQIRVNALIAVDEAQCQRDIKSFLALPPAQKAKAQSPVCEVNP